MKNWKWTTSVSLSDTDTEHGCNVALKLTWCLPLSFELVLVQFRHVLWGYFFMGMCGAVDKGIDS